MNINSGLRQPKQNKQKGCFAKSKSSFLKVFLDHPFKVGAITPTSEYTAKEMAAFVDLDPQATVIELGPGTGVITQALLDRGIKPENIIAIEYSDEFVEILRKRFPKVKIIQGDVADLTKLVGHNNKISAVVSSIPMVFLPKAKGDHMLHQIKDLLVRGGKYISITYNILENRFHSLEDFEHFATKRVWRNIPPARLDVYRTR